MFQLPEGVHRIIDRPLAIRLGIILLGSIVLGLGDMIGVAAVLPLVQVIMGGEYSPWLQRISDFFGNPPSDQLAIYLATVMAGAFVLKSILGLWFRWWTSGVTARAEARAATEMFAKFMAAPYWLHRHRGVPEILRAVNQSVSFAYGYVGLVLAALTEFVTIVGLGITLAVIMPIPTIAATAYFGIATVGIYRLTKMRIEALSRESLEVELGLNRTVLQSLYGFRESRLHGLSGPAVKSFATDKAELVRFGRLIGFFSGLPRHLLDLIFFVGVGLLIAIVFSTSGTASGLGQIAVFVAASSRILPSLVRITGSFSGLRSSRPGVQIFLYEHSLLDKWERESLEVPTEWYPRGDVEFRDVHFAYPNVWAPVLRGVSVTIKQGDTVAIVGASGSGKTTMVDVLVGLLAPQAGEVLVAGKSVADDRVAWRRHVAMVPQDVFILDDTLRENIVMGGAEDEALLTRVLEQAQLASLVTELPDGLKTKLGERGTRLSGGQRQRIGIARALYRQPDLLVLDEATSALDNVTEFQITETMREIRGAMTVVVVAHRLSTIKHADVLLFMKDGQIVSRGTFAEVQRDNAEFARLVELGSISGVLADHS